MAIQENGRVTGECRKPISFGLRGEDRLSELRPFERRLRHEKGLNGAKAFLNTERDYNGGSSIVDRADRLERE